LTLKHLGCLFRPDVGGVDHDPVEVDQPGGVAAGEHFLVHLLEHSGGLPVA